MEIQTLIVMLIVLAAAAYVGRRFWLAVRGTRAVDAGDAACAGGGCGCASSAQPAEAVKRTLSKNR